MVSGIASTEKRANGILTFGIYVTDGGGSIALVNVWIKKKDKSSLFNVGSIRPRNKSIKAK